MKPLGVIGGISSESNSLYYQIITVDSSYVLLCELSVEDTIHTVSKHKI